MAEDLEGDPKRYPFSEEEWYLIRTSQKTVLSKGISGRAKALYGTKFFRKPLQTMKDRVQDIIANKDTSNSLRYIIYSAHDTQIINILDWLAPVGHEYIDATYGSTVYFEVHYDTDCLAANPGSTSCFSVHMTHNGQTIKLSTCLDANIKRNSSQISCLYDDFIAHIDKIKVNDDVNLKCQDKFDPKNPN